MRNSEQNEIKKKQKEKEKKQWLKLHKYEFAEHIITQMIFSL